MFEAFAHFIGKDSGPNRFWTVKEPDIAEAEYRIGIPFPRTLRDADCGSRRDAPT